jgi:hypothetical protein
MLRRIIFSGRMSESGQKETKNHVRCNVGFPQKRPLRPLYLAVLMARAKASGLGAFNIAVGRATASGLITVDIEGICPSRGPHKFRNSPPEVPPSEAPAMPM